MSAALPRLSPATLADLARDIVRPDYDRGAVRRGVVHLGIGAFHRAHQAVLFDDALATGDMRWGIVGVSLRSPAVRDQLAPQGGLYTLAERDGTGERLRVIGAVCDVLVAPDDPAKVIAAMAAADTHLVTLTVTEKGYRLDPRSGALLVAEPDIAADLADLTRPRTVPGLIAAALGRRRVAGLPPFTAISCDNVPDNGPRLRRAVLDIAHAHDAGLARWIEAEGAFPQTMVDRIVPATTPADRAAIAQRIGMEDQGAVITEPFRQWVIEDRFAGPRPDFAALGAQLTSDVAPWETAKLRLLNGAHSAIAYLGGLAGIDFVHQFVALPTAQRFVEALWDEAAETLQPSAGPDLASYRPALMARFANPALQHRTRQIAVDGSQKLPQRLVAPLLARRVRGLRVDALALAIAAWMRWQGGRDDAGDVFAVDDPLANVTARALATAHSAEERVMALLAIEAVFPPALRDDRAAVAAIVDALRRIEADGALDALEQGACA